MPKDLYNQEQKERFLESVHTSEKMKMLFRNVFEYVSTYEVNRQADICTWNKEELEGVLENLAGIRSYSSDNRAQLLRRYIRWCKDNDVAGASDAIFETEATGRNKIKEMTVSGPDDLQQRLDSFLDPVRSLSADLILRGYCWLAFMGLSEEESLAISVNDVDLDDRCIVWMGQRYSMPEEAFECLKALKGSSLNYYHPRYGEKTVYRERAAGDKLLRGFRNPEPSVKILRSMLANNKAKARKEGKSETKISYYRIWLSGEFYRMYQNEQNGGPVDFLYLGERAIQVREENNRPYKLVSENGKRTENGKIRELARDYETDYRRWKATYYP